MKKIFILTLLITSNTNALEYTSRTYIKSDIKKLEVSLLQMLRVQSNRLATQEVNINKIIDFELDRIEELVDNFRPMVTCQCQQSECDTTESSSPGHDHDAPDSDNDGIDNAMDRDDRNPNVH